MLNINATEKNTKIPHMYCSQLDQSSKQTKKKEKTNRKGIILIRGGGGRWMCSAPEGSELDLHLELSLNDNIASCLVRYSSAEGFCCFLRRTNRLLGYEGDSDDSFVFDEG